MFLPNRISKLMPLLLAIVILLAGCETKKVKFNSLEEALLSPDDVKELVLSKKNLTELSSDIGRLKNLEILRLGHNDLERLPSTIGELSNLRQLHLGYNKLEELPEDISRLNNLKELRLGYNKLERLPESIGSLGNLKRLHIGHNPLKELPASMSNLKPLVHLGCNNTMIPNEDIVSFQTKMPSVKVKY